MVRPRDYQCGPRGLSMCKILQQERHVSGMETFLRPWERLECPDTLSCVLRFTASPRSSFSIVCWLICVNSIVLRMPIARISSANEVSAITFFALPYSFLPEDGRM